MRDGEAMSEAPALSGAAADFAHPGVPDLLGRWDRHQAFWDARLTAGLDPTGRVTVGRIGAEIRAMGRGGEPLSGVNFASGDHLSLAPHPAVREAAVEAVGRFGVHAGAAATLSGGSQPLIRLEERLAEWLCCREATVFPSGWAACYGAVRALVRPGDHVVMDCLVRPAVQEAAAAATRNVHPMPHAMHDAFAGRLSRLRAENPRAGILVVTETAFALDGAVPDLRALRDACRQHGATLMVVASHDLGATGDGGHGFLGRQGMVGEVDVLVGSLSSVFASPGGFVAGDAPGLRGALRHFASPLASSCALSPVSAATALAAFDIVASVEGAQRRRRLAANVARLRESLAARAFHVLGEPSGVVPVVVGGLAAARLMTRAVLEMGAMVNLVEHPSVSRGGSRWPLQVMADHTPEQLDRLVTVAIVARERAERMGTPRLAVVG